MPPSPPPLPPEAVVQEMPEPLTPEFYAWLAPLEHLSTDRLVEHTGCRVRGCRVGRSWDAEHGCHVFVHNGKIVGWELFRLLNPPARTDAEAFCRAVYDEHRLADGKPVLAAVRAPAPREPSGHLPGEEQRLINKIYAERDMCVALACRLALMAGLKSYLALDESQPEGWKHVVFVELPGGQAAWHIHDKELPWFKHLGLEPNRYDGHTTEEKYARCLAPWPWETRP